MIAQSIPLFFALVVGLSMLVLAGRLPLARAPAVGAALNLSRRGAAFGISVAVFQWGWGHSLHRARRGGPIEPFIPLILFALLFGLSMDYQVFLVSRIAELWHARATTRSRSARARRGVSRDRRRRRDHGGGVRLVRDLRRPLMKLLGLGLAVAIFLDAFVIRVVLMPAIMRLLGPREWWMPAWLDRIMPHIDIDGGDTPGEVGPTRAPLQRAGVGAAAAQEVCGLLG